MENHRVFGCGCIICNYNRIAPTIWKIPASFREIFAGCFGLFSTRERGRSRFEARNPVFSREQEFLISHVQREERERQRFPAAEHIDSLS